MPWLSVSLEPSNGHGYLGRLSAYWNASFPGERPSTPVLPAALTAVEFEMEGQVLRAVSVGWGDTGFSPVLHLPSAAAVIGGDVAYNGVHMMTAGTDAKTRDAWIASLDAVAALEPRIVVAGHKSVGAADGPECIAASQQYLRDFTRIVDQSGTVEQVVAAMRSQSPARSRGPPARGWSRHAPYGVDGADTGGNGGGRTRDRGSNEPRDRRAVVPLTAHGQRTPAPCVRKTRSEVPRRTDAGRGRAQYTSHVLTMRRRGSGTMLALMQP